MLLQLFLFILLSSNICNASYSAEYNALWDEESRPQKTPEWWKDGMGYKNKYWPQASHTHPQCGRKGEKEYSEYNEKNGSPILIAQSTEFVNKLQQALHNGDKRAFASLVSYPLRWNITHNYMIYLHTPDQVIYHYDAMMNNRMKKILLDIKVGSDEAPYVFLSNSYLSLMVASGVLWLQCEMKIYVVNNMDENLKAAKLFCQSHPDFWYP